MVLKDNCGRPLLNLRVAITRRCNLRCEYCHMEGEERQLEETSREMTTEQIVRVARIAVGLGISRIKITGGEPLMRKDVIEIVKGMAVLPGLEDLSMTTNGTMLPFLADGLRSAGLQRLNITLPSLDSKVYRILTGGRINDALDGVKKAVETGFNPVKLNMVILNRVNDAEVPEMMQYAARSGTILQLIELEPINVEDDYYVLHHRLPDDYEDALRQKAVKVESRRFMQNRHVYQLPDVRVEIVHPIENTEFCMHCTRLRVTSDGKLKPCLMKNSNLIDILTPMVNGANDEELEKLFRLANQNRQPFNLN
jgi:cyclic pyranopterin phosphate synthase